jgi:hypothetical protein
VGGRGSERGEEWEGVVEWVWVWGLG